VEKIEGLSNHQIWKQLGDHLLMVQPFMDSIIVGGDGCYLIDADGKRILDLAAGQFCSILGHSHEGFLARLKHQVGELVHIGDQYTSQSVLRAAARLAEVAPGNLNKVIFLSTGSEANECAMRMAKTITGRTGMLGFTRGYYGISLATRTLSSISDHPWKTDFQPALPSQYKLITPACRRCPIKLEYPSCDLRCLDVSFEMIGDNARNIAAVFIEPILSAGGMVIPPKDYFKALKAKVQDLGALFIADEAQTGFGRCGRWFDIENYEIEPDILVVSKTAGNGYPAAAVIVSEALGAVLESKTFMHLSSHQNDPLAAVAVNAVIDAVDKEKLVDHSYEMGIYFMDQLRTLKERHSLISDVRGRGLMIGLELAAQSKRPGNTAFDMAMLCESKGLHITFSYFEPVIRIIPPLIIAKKEIDHAITLMGESLQILTDGSYSLASIMPANPKSGPMVERMRGGFSFMESMKKLGDTTPRQLFKKVKEKFQRRE